MKCAVSCAYNGIGENWKMTTRLKLWFTYKTILKNDLPLFSHYTNDDSRLAHCFNVCKFHNPMCSFHKIVCNVHRNGAAPTVGSRRDVQKMKDAPFICIDLATARALGVCYREYLIGLVIWISNEFCALEFQISLFNCTQKPHVCCICTRCAHRTAVNDDNCTLNDTDDGRNTTHWAHLLLCCVWVYRCEQKADRHFMNNEQCHLMRCWPRGEH